MLSNLKGQPRAAAVLAELFGNRSSGRTLLFTGADGLGKITAAVELARDLLGCDPFFSPAFQYYRVDDFALKTRFFLEMGALLDSDRRVVNYFSQLLARLSAAIAYDGIQKSAPTLKKPKSARGGEKKWGLSDYQADLEEALLNGVLSDRFSDSAFIENTIAVSDKLSDKRVVPIDFVRALIDFHSVRSAAPYRISVVGGFDAAGEEAQNAALKIMEEPPERSVIILTSANPARILPTILSRAVNIQFHPLPPSVVLDVVTVNEGQYQSAREAMEERVYHYARESRRRIADFFTRVVPAVSTSDALFGFTDSLADADNNRLTEVFLEEMASFFRGLNLYRQSISMGFEASVLPEYRPLYEAVVRGSFASELSGMAQEAATLKERLARGSWSEKNTLPAYLVGVARWYLRRRGPRS